LRCKVAGIDRCCSRAACTDVFDEKFARRMAARYRRRGLDKTACRLFEFLRGRGETVLEIGGGVGELEIELLRAGATQAVNVELSRAYEREGAKLVADSGVQGRVEWRYGDVAVERDLVNAADIVVMHRVVCCYPDMPALVGVAADKTQRALALSFPRDSWLVRVGARFVNGWCRLRRSAFRFYVHRPDAIARVAGEHGLHAADTHTGRIWQVAAFARD
jgi:Methyltransferase domain